jgi:hypothetical protein
MNGRIGKVGNGFGDRRESGRRFLPPHCHRQKETNQTFPALYSRQQDPKRGNIGGLDPYVVNTARDVNLGQIDRSQAGGGLNYYRQDTPECLAELHYLRRCHEYRIIMNVIDRRRSRWGRTPRGLSLKSASDNTIFFSSRIQRFFLIVAANSTIRNALCTFTDWCGPHFNTSCLCRISHNGVC